MKWPLSNIRHCNVSTGADFSCFVLLNTTETWGVFWIHFVGHDSVGFRWRTCTHCFIRCYQPIRHLVAIESGDVSVKVLCWPHSRSVASSAVGRLMRNKFALIHLSRLAFHDNQQNMSYVIGEKNYLPVTPPRRAPTRRRPPPTETTGSERSGRRLFLLSRPASWPLSARPENFSARVRLLHGRHPNCAHQSVTLLCNLRTLLFCFRILVIVMSF